MLRTCCRWPWAAPLLLRPQPLAGRRCRSGPPAPGDVSPEDAEAVQRFRAKFTRAAIPYKSFHVTFQRSSGAGGQNVNKVSTKVCMRFALAEQTWLPAYVRRRLRELDAGRINARGEYQITSERTRSQRHNIDDCLDRLWQQIDRAAALPTAPRPETVERVRGLQRAEKARDIESKKRRSVRKAGRRGGADDL